MKFGIICLLLLTSIGMKSDNDVKQLLAHKWIQFAWKSHSETQPSPTDASMAKECTFSEDGSYAEVMYNNTYKATGKWVLNADKTKIGWSLTNLNGTALSEFPGPIRTNTVILKLTADTLIYGNEAYYGADRVYGHDDWYFVRAK